MALNGWKVGVASGCYFMLDTKLEGGRGWVLIRSDGAFMD